MSGPSSGVESGHLLLLFSTPLHKPHGRKCLEAVERHPCTPSGCTACIRILHQFCADAVVKMICIGEWNGNVRSNKSLVCDSTNVDKIPVHNDPSPSMVGSPDTVKVQIPTTVAFATTGGISVRISRGDKTPLELFVGGVRGWEAAVRRRMTGEMPAK